MFLVGFIIRIPNSWISLCSFHFQGSFFGYWYLYNNLHTVIKHKIRIFIIADVKASKVAKVFHIKIRSPKECSYLNNFIVAFYAACSRFTTCHMPRAFILYVVRKGAENYVKKV